MFKSLRSPETSKINNSGRSHVGETMQLEGDLRTSGAIDVAGLINGNIFVSEINTKVYIFPQFDTDQCSDSCRPDVFSIFFKMKKHKICKKRK